MTHVLAQPIEPYDCERLRAIREAQRIDLSDPETFTRAAENYVPHCGHEQYTPPYRVPRTEYLAATRSTNGRVCVFVICIKCGRWKSPQLPWNLLRVPPQGIPLVWDQASSKTCQVADCMEIGAEWHHWAPRCLFGNDADNWPKSWLCPKHHAEWHRVTRTRAVMRQEETA
jgi:hypothetical protein